MSKSVAAEGWAAQRGRMWASVAPDSLVPAERASEQGGQAGCRLVSLPGGGGANLTPRLGTRFGRTNGNKGSMRDWD